MSQYGNTRPIEGLVRRGMNQPIPDLTQPPPVAVPGLDVLAPAPSGLAGQVANVFEGAVGLTMAGARFANMMRERDALEQSRQDAYERQTRQDFQAVEEQFSKVRAGEAVQAWGVDREILLGQLDRGELPMPKDLTEQTLRGWAKDITTSRTSGQGEIYSDAYANAATNDLIAAVQRKASAVSAKDKAELTKTLAGAAASASGPDDLEKIRGQATALNLDWDQIMVAGAESAARQGTRAFAKFGNLLADEKYTIERRLLEQTAQQADYEAGRRLAEQKQEARANRADLLSGFDDEIAGMLYKSDTLGDYRKVEATVVAAMEHNPDLRSELFDTLNRVRGRIDQYADKQTRLQLNDALNANMQSQLTQAKALYVGGEGYKIPETTVATATVGDAVDQKNVPGFRRMVQDAAMSDPAVPFVDKLKMLAGDADKYEPFVNLIRAGSNVGEVTFDKEGKLIVPERTVSAIELYAEMRTHQPELALKYAGESAPFYEGVLELQREVGGDPRKAVAEYVRREQSVKADAIPYTDDKLRSDAKTIDGINNENYPLVAARIRSRYNKLQQSGTPAERARELSIKMTAGEVKVVNGHPMFVGDRQTPDGVYGSFTDTATAYIDYLKTKHKDVRAFDDPVEWDGVRMNMNQLTGVITLVNELNQPLNIPIQEREFRVDELLKYAENAKKEGVLTRSKMPKEMSKPIAEGALPWSRLPAEIFKGLQNSATDPTSPFIFGKPNK